MKLVDEWKFKMRLEKEPELSFMGQGRHCEGELLPSVWRTCSHMAVESEGLGIVRSLTSK